MRLGPFSEPYKRWGGPLKLDWAGWSTDTHRLQVAGWELSAIQDPVTDSMRIAVRHERHNVRGVTPNFNFHYRKALHDPRLVDHLPPVPIALASQLWIRMPDIPRVSAFAPIDARPSVDMFDEVSLDTLAHFRPLARDELIVPEETVGDLLKRIVDMQSGARLERFRDQVREEQASKRLIVPHAQIISLREAA